MTNLARPDRPSGCSTAAFSALLLVILLLISSCTSSQPVQTSSATARPGVSPTLAPTRPITSTPTKVPEAPAHYVAHTLLQGNRRPDDLAFDLQGRLLFSDEFNGTVSRLNPDGTVTTLLRGLAGPEGIVALPDGRFIVAEQETNRILAFSPGSQ
ncbi:MAG TPA: hypothetical protein VFN35_05225, partial [Ktedonobacteraceae bacterium]|nr:hypothetical protein [Ktedonobacteraceae bacterium]